MGLVNGAMGTVQAICYKSGETPPDLPVAVMMHFDTYSGPTLPDGTVPITPIRHSWSTSGAQCTRLQFPLRLVNEREDRSMIAHARDECAWRVLFFSDIIYSGHYLESLALFLW